MDRDELNFQIKKGLMSSPKYIPAWFAYDKEGSEMYSRYPIENPHYYSYNAEIEVLKERSQEIVDDLPTPCALVDLGSGSGIKTKYLIDAFLRKQGYLHYIPVDISEEYLNDMCKTRLTEYGDKLNITPVAGVYETGIKALRDVDSAKLIVWICGLQNIGYQRQIEYLKFFHDHMSEQDRLIISADTTVDESKINLSYNHGLNAKWTLHQVKRLNKEFRGNIDIGCFQLETDFVLQSSEDTTSYFRCWLRSLKCQSFYITDVHLKLDFTENERLYLHEGEGISCKYNTAQLHSLIRKGKFHLHKTWRDNEKHMAFVCLKKSK